MDNNAYCVTCESIGLPGFWMLALPSDGLIYQTYAIQQSSSECTFMGLASIKDEDDAKNTAFSQVPQHLYKFK